ncbi:MAG: SNF2-related protein, partial [Acidiferrobacter sp.]
MAKVKEIALQRAYQMAVCRFARQMLMRRTGGIVLADGVGLGKTYEALGTVAALLSQSQHGKKRLRRNFHILILVPPGLVTKWADELQLPERFPRYLKNWTGRTQRAVADTFRDVVVLRGQHDLNNTQGRRRYGTNELPSGLYLVNSNLLFKDGKKVTQIYRTRWDAMIIDEAHHVADKLVKLKRGRELLARRGTRTILLTATPFQLTPHEMKGLLAATSCGDRNEAERLYNHKDFKAYRNALKKHFESGAI